MCSWTCLGHSSIASCALYYKHIINTDKPTKSRVEDICCDSSNVYWCLQSINYHIAAVKWKGLLYDCPCREKHKLIKGKQHAWDIACWDKKCRKNLRVSHDTTLSIYDDIVQNRCILPLLMILTKLFITSNVATHKWQVKASSTLQSYTIAGHAWGILSSQTF